MLAWYYLRSNAEKSIGYFLVAERAREGRQLFRIFKSLFEAKRILLIASSDTDRFTKLAIAFSRAFYLMHWLAENVYILAKSLLAQYLWPKFPLG